MDPEFLFHYLRYSKVLAISVIASSTQNELSYMYVCDSHVCTWPLCVHILP